MKYLLLLILILSGCNSTTSKATDDSPLKMKCFDVGKSIRRCENIEVVCYDFVGDYSALSCIPKKLIENRN